MGFTSTSFLSLPQSNLTRGDGRNDGAASRPDGPARPIVTVALFWGAPGTGKSAAAEALGFEFGRVPRQQVAHGGSTRAQADFGEGWALEHLEAN